MGFGLGVYVGTIYDCKPTVTFISTCLKNNIPKDALHYILIIYNGITRIKIWFYA